MSLQRALLLLVVTTLFAGIVPAGLVIDRRLAREVEARARAELAQAPRLLTDRNEAQAEAMLMHAKEIAQAPGLAEALNRGNRSAALHAAELARGKFADGVVLISTQEEAWSGPFPGRALLAAVRRGETPTTFVLDSGALHLVSLVSVMRGRTWLGAAGIKISLGAAAAGAFSTLTGADVLFLSADGTLIASTPSDSVNAAIAPQAARIPNDGQVHLVTAGERRYLLNAVKAGDASNVVFVRDLTRELAVLPAFRRIVVFSGAAAVLLGLLLGVVLARRIAQPVTVLAKAADRLAAGDVDAPLMRSSIREIDRLADAFDAMRQALSLRISDVTGANRNLTDRQTRFESSQSEILQRERLAVSSRLVAELSHEIRNPIANLRNCLEVIKRRVTSDAQASEFTDLAIDELLRMHELAEQLLDLNRPRDPAVRIAEVDKVIHEVVVLASAGAANELLLEIAGRAGAGVSVPIAPDALKQILLNLVQNAREALGEQPPAVGKPGRITISARAEAVVVLVQVTDTGPGIPEAVLPRVFDPFFTTKGAVHGVGLGLFVAEGLVRTAGGRISVANRAEGGAAFLLELPRVPDLRGSEAVVLQVSAPPLALLTTAASRDDS